MVKKRLVIGGGIAGLGIAWVINGILEMNKTGEIRTDNTIGLGVVTLVIALFVFRKLKKIKHSNNKNN